MNLLRPTLLKWLFHFWSGDFNAAEKWKNSESLNCISLKFYITELTLGRLILICFPFDLSLGLHIFYFYFNVTFKIYKHPPSFWHTPPHTHPHTHPLYKACTFLCEWCIYYFIFKSTLFYKLCFKRWTFQDCATISSGCNSILGTEQHRTFRRKQTKGEKDQSALDTISEWQDLWQVKCFRRLKD